MKKATPRKSKKRKITAEDLYNLRVVTGSAMSPDETKVAYTVERMDREDTVSYTHLRAHET